MKISKPEYLEKALLLPEDERERVLSRMTGKLPRRLEKDKLSVDEALAIQLEIEDEQLNEWRERMHSIQKNDKDKKVKPEEKAKVEAEPKVTEKMKATPKEKAVVPVEAKKPAVAKPRAATRSK